MTEPTLTRLNKYISDTGFCSRREADSFIANGDVTVNGQPAQMGVKVSAADTILVKGQPLRSKPKRVYLAYHKPVGITCTTERHIHGNIIDAVKYPERIFPIGRLDKPSEGLIFLTNDGDIVNKVLRAGNAHEKEYVVTVNKPINEHFVRKMSQGVPILNTVTLPCQVTQVSRNTFKIILTQGLNRQIRRMAEFCGYEVVKLKRTRIMHIRLADLKPGKWRLLDPIEIKMLEQLVQDSSKTIAATSSQDDFEE